MHSGCNDAGYTGTLGVTRGCLWTGIPSPSHCPHVPMTPDPDGWDDDPGPVGHARRFARAAAAVAALVAPFLPPPVRHVVAGWARVLGALVLFVVHLF